MPVFFFFNGTPEKDWQSTSTIVNLPPVHFHNMFFGKRKKAYTEDQTFFFFFFPFLVKPVFGAICKAS